jgi:replicative DNA helicase
MTLSDMTAYRHVIGGLIHKPQLLLEYDDIKSTDFDYAPAVVCFNAIRKFYSAGSTELSVMELDQEITRAGGRVAQVYADGNGLEFLKHAYEQPENFSFYYERLKKNSLLRKLKQAKYDISEFYVEEKDAISPSEEYKVQQHLDDSSIEEILNSVEKKYAEIRNNFLNGGHLKGDPAEGIDQLIENLRKSPSIGPSLEGKIFSSACRGAREGCFFLKNASTSAGKTRTSVFDACHLAYPERWSWAKENFIEEVNAEGEARPPRKVLFIVTEMDKEELQTIMLAYLSGVDEDHILTGKYEGCGSEYARVQYAAEIMKKYSGYFLVEEISEPNLQNVEATIRKYATVDNVKYVFFDYIHSTASMVEHFTRNNLREDSILMMMANQLKQLAKDYNIFIFSSTQVNAAGMNPEDLAFMDEKTIRGAKSIADKADVGFGMQRVSAKAWNSVLSSIRAAVNEGIIPEDILFNPPTHVLDIYKMRRGRYKMVRIWIRLHLGTGYREDLFITTAENQPIDEPMDLFSSSIEKDVPAERSHYDKYSSRC